MLRVYAASWCPHCTMTVEYLEERGIEMDYIDIEAEPDAVVQQVIEANGGDDWVVPTLEYKGKWRPGKMFDAEDLERDLKRMGVIDQESAE